MKVKYHTVMATLQRPSANAILMDITHADYGTILGAWVPKSVLLDSSLEEIEESADGDTIELSIQAWWFRRNYESR